MKAHFLGLALLGLWLTPGSVNALDDNWLQDDQTWLQNQLSQDQAQLAKLNQAKLNAQANAINAGINIAADNGGVTDYAKGASLELIKQQYRQLERQVRQEERALRKVNNRIGQLGTTMPPQQHGGMDNCPPGTYQEKFMPSSSNQDQLYKQQNGSQHGDLSQHNMSQRHNLSQHEMAHHDQSQHNMSQRHNLAQHEMVHQQQHNMLSQRHMSQTQHPQHLQQKYTAQSNRKHHPH